MKGQRLQAQFIRKRDIEQAKIQRTSGKQKVNSTRGKVNSFGVFFSAVQKYYDHWGRVTSRHEHWSTPDYYQEAEDKMRKRLESEEKQKTLSERQERLKALLNAEIVQFEKETKGGFN